jgi:thiol:disulfide interchange protein DsbA
MKLRPMRNALLLTGLFVLAACSQQQAPAPAETSASAAASAPAAAPAGTAPAEAAPAAAEATAAAPAPAEALNNNPIVPPAGPPAVAGTDYVEIPGGQPYEPANGKIEVVEVFGYVCPACAQFQPLVSAWKKKLPADVRFTYVPAPFGPDWMPYARGYYVAQSMGLVERTHDALVDAIHIKNSMPGEGDKPTDEAVAQFYAGYGANAQDFLGQMQSFATSTKVNRGKQFMMRSGVEATPTLVVAGKYRIKGRSFEDMLRVADQLIATERAKGATAAPAGG